MGVYCVLLNLWWGSQVHHKIVTASNPYCWAIYWRSQRLLVSSMPGISVTVVLGWFILFEHEDPSFNWRLNTSDVFFACSIRLSVCLQGNKTEYKSVTVARNATAEEMTDFYLDDNYRSKWVNSRVEYWKHALHDSVVCSAFRLLCQLEPWQT